MYFLYLPFRADRRLVACPPCTFNGYARLAWVENQSLIYFQALLGLCSMERKRLKPCSLWGLGSYTILCQCLEGSDRCLEGSVLLVDCNGRFFFCPIDHLLCQNLETVSFPRLPFSISFTFWFGQTVVPFSDLQEGEETLSLQMGQPSPGMCFFLGPTQCCSCSYPKKNNILNFIIFLHAAGCQRSLYFCQRNREITNLSELLNSLIA